jgi:DNA-binding transcriptional MerR regulator
LHHYDRTRLLRPTARSEAGHRLYSDGDLLRLQQILTLRYLGFALKQIGVLLDRPDFDLVASLQIQRVALRDRILELEHVEAALAELLERRRATGHWAWDLVVKASAAVQDGLRQKGEQMNDYYSPEHMKHWEELGKQVSPEERSEIERQWAALIADVRANRHLDPASGEAQALAERWEALVDATFRGNQELMAAVGENYRQGRFADRSDAPQAEDFAFIARANEAWKGKGGSRS